MTSNLVIRSSLVLLIIVAVAASVTVAMSARAEEREYHTVPTWPAFSMLYTTPGYTYTRGQGEPVTVTETHRLDYVSATQWVNTIVYSPDVTTAVGTHNRIGQYTALNGSTYSEHDSDGNVTHTETVADDTTFIVGTMPAPFPIVASGVETTTTTTTAKVCFQEECAENVGGVLYTMDNGSELVFVDDARGIPLRVNESFVVKEITIQDSKQAIVR